MNKQILKQTLKQTLKQVTKQSVGFDVSKDTVAACFSQQEVGTPFRILSSKNFPLNAKGFALLQEWIVKQHIKTVDLHMLMEATGVYYEELAYFLHGKSYRVTVLLPNKTSAYCKSLDYKSKTDKIDAKKLAQMSLERELQVWTPPSDKMLEIKRLCRERGELIDERTAFGNRRHAKVYSHAPVKSSLKRSEAALKFLNKQIKEVEKTIKDVVAKDPDIKERMDNVCTIPGVKITTAAVIVSETNGFALFKGKGQVVSYAGYDVLKEESGTSLKKLERISKKGNSRIRKALHYPALTAIRCIPEMKSLKDRIFAETKIKMKGCVAVQRKLLVLIYTLYKNNKPFDPNFKAVQKTAQP